MRYQCEIWGGNSSYIQNYPAMDFFIYQNLGTISWKSTISGLNDAKKDKNIYVFTKYLFVLQTWLEQYGHKFLAFSRASRMILE